MAWTQERSYVNQKVQIGAESNTALGTPVAAGKVLQCFNWVFAPMADVMIYRPVGRKYPGVQIENSEWVEGTVDGPLDFNGIIYPLNSAMGAVSPVAHGASLIAKDWIFTPPVTGSIVPQTYTIQQGDTITRAHQLAYALISEFGYKGDRRAGVTFAGKALAQPLSDGITMTGSPTLINLSPVAGKMFNFYLDTTSANLGTTQLLKVLNVDFMMPAIYGMFFPFNRANLGWTAHVDLAPATIVKLLMEADSVGMTELTYLQSGSTQFLRVQALGPQIDNSWVVTLGTQSSGTFTLTYKGQTTAGIAWNATAATVQTAIALLSTIPTGLVNVTGGTGGPYTVQFTGSLTTDTSALSGSGALLTTPANFGIVTAVVNATFQHDMAVKVSKPTPFQDKNGVFAEEWELAVMEDPTWGNAHKVTVTNLLTAL